MFIRNRNRERERKREIDKLTIAEKNDGWFMSKDSSKRKVLKEGKMNESYMKAAKEESSKKNILEEYIKNKTVHIEKKRTNNRQNYVRKLREKIG